jgi:hypothetical protein
VVVEIFSRFDSYLALSVSHHVEARVCPVHAQYFRLAKSSSRYSFGGSEGNLKASRIGNCDICNAQKQAKDGHFGTFVGHFDSNQ